MQKLTTLIILCLLAGILCTSGCIKTTPTNNTFGEKKISLDALIIVNNTTAGNYSYEGKNYYYIVGYIKNYNLIDAVKVKMKATFYAANGSVVATSKNVYLDPKSIPAKGESQFYFEIIKPKQIIVNYKIEVISAETEYYV